MSKREHDFDLFMIGHFAVDRNVVDGRPEVASGGAVYYGAVAARRLGARVGVATRLHPADFGRLDEMRAEGIAVYAVPAPATSGIENVYRSADMERRTCRPLSFAGPFQPGDIPLVATHICAVVPIMAGEVDLPLLRQLGLRMAEQVSASQAHRDAACPAGIALDVQGFVRVRVGDQLLFQPWEEMSEGLSYVTYLKVDQAEAELLTGETDLAQAARRLAALGPREIVLTQSSGVTVYAEGEIYRAPFVPRSLAGRTGRGDTCFAAYLAQRLRMGPAEACRWAAAVTTLKQEQPGPWRGTLADAEALLKKLAAG